MSEWSESTLGEVVNFQRGFDITRAIQRAGTVPVVSSGGISSYHDTAAVHAPGVVIGRKGTLGKVFYLEKDYWPHDTTLWVQDFKSSDPRFVYYFMSQVDVSWLDAGSANPTLNRNHLHPLPVLWPPVADQRAIAEVLGALDDKIAANNKIARTIESLGSAKFTRMGLDVEPSDEAVLLGDVFELNPRRTVTSASPTVIDMQALPTTHPLVERWNTGIRKGGARFSNGDTLVARITPCLENRKTAFVDFLKAGDVGIGSTEFIVMRSKNDLPLGLSYFMAVSERFRDFAIQNLVGTSGRQRVSAADLARHTLCPVDPSELRAFGEWADANLKVLGSLRGENHTLSTMRDALLPQLMKGKLRVKDAEAVVAAAV